jgi:two-component sensor histidine kinase
VCEDIAAATPDCNVEVAAMPGIVIRTDRAVAAALAVNEMITNAAKYAYPGRRGSIRVGLTRDAADRVSIAVRDEGEGLPADFDVRTGGLGMRLVRSFAQQLQGELQVVRHDPGTEFVLVFSLNV